MAARLSVVLALLSFCATAQFASGADSNAVDLSPGGQAPGLNQTGLAAALTLDRESTAAGKGLVIPNCLNSSALCADWGYEDQAPVAPLQSVEEHAAPARSMSQAKATNSKLAVKGKPSVSSGAAGSQPGAGGKAGSLKTSSRTRLPTPNTVSDRDSILQQRAVEDWIELYTFVTSSSIADEQKSHLRDAMNQECKAGKSEDVLSILDFWLQARKSTFGNPDQMENYRDLFRALLRLQSRSSTSTDDQEMIAEVLGPTRIAVPGDPPFTEDAINAYADMACFLYEQKNPGKTLDAVDNRAMFAQVIVDKFKDAPTAKDKQAMINFDLNWAKFKILWTGADEARKKELLKQWTSDQTARQVVSSDPTLDLVLHRGPWHTSLFPKSAAKQDPSTKTVR